MSASGARPHAPICLRAPVWRGHLVLKERAGPESPPPPERRAQAKKRVLESHGDRDGGGAAGVSRSSSSQTPARQLDRMTTTTTTRQEEEKARGAGRREEDEDAYSQPQAKVPAPSEWPRRPARFSRKGRPSIDAKEIDKASELSYSPDRDPTARPRPPHRT